LVVVVAEKVAGRLRWKEVGQMPVKALEMLLGGIVYTARIISFSELGLELGLGDLVQSCKAFPENGPEITEANPLASFTNKSEKSRLSLNLQNQCLLSFVSSWYALEMSPPVIGRRVRPPRGGGSGSVIRTLCRISWILGGIFWLIASDLSDFLSVRSKVGAIE
jgi:hypothetical protein